MLEQIMSHKKFWIVRVRDRVDQHCTYVGDLGITKRPKWYFTDDHTEAEHFKTRRSASAVLDSRIWDREGYLAKKDYIIEIVQIDETITKEWADAQIITNENALIQLARLGEDVDEYDHPIED